MGDVNNLYGMILRLTIEPDDDEDIWEYERFRWIVGFVIALKEPIGDLSGLLDLELLSFPPVSLKLRSPVLNLNQVRIRYPSKLELNS